MRFSPSLFLLSFPLSFSLLPRVSTHAAPPNPDQLYSLQRAAFLAAESSSLAYANPPSSTSTSTSERSRHKKPKLEKKKKKQKSKKEKLTKLVKDHDDREEEDQVVLQKIKKGSASHLHRQGRMEKLRRKRHGNEHLNRPRSEPRAVAVVSTETTTQVKVAVVEKEKKHEVQKRGKGTFKGVSSYYLFALDDGPRRAVLDAIKGGGFSVVRIFLSGVAANNKGSGNSAVPDLEPNEVGTYDDTILYKIDKLMADCADRGLKLVIALSDRYALGFWSTNSYAVQLSIVQPSQKGQQSLKVKSAHAFYSDSWAIKMYEQRMSHALNHQNQLMGGQKWKDLSSVVYAFEAQNEPQGYMDPSTVNPSWVCDRSNSLASQVSGSGIQISSGGGIDTSSSLASWATGCGSIDIVSVHDYGTNGWNTANTLANAQNNHPGKTIMMGEWGLTGSNKAAKISEFVSAFESKGIPWMYWQITQPGAGASDFEVWTTEPSWGSLTGGSYSYSSPNSGSSNANKGNSNSSSSNSSSSFSSYASVSTSRSSSKQSSSSSQPSSASSGSNSTSANVTSTWTSAAPASTIYEGADGSGNDSTIATGDSQVSTISPADLSGYSIVSPDSSSSTPPSSTATDSALLPLETGNSTSFDNSTYFNNATSVLPTPTDNSTLSTLLPNSSSSLNESDSSSIATEISNDTVSTPLPMPTSTTLEGGALVPNCNYTLEQVSSGNVTLDTNSTIVLLPSGIYCNSTILPLSDPTTVVAGPASPLPSGDVSLVFSTDPTSVLPDFSTDSPPTSPETPATATVPENGTAPIHEIPTPSPSPSPEYHEITLDGDALATMDLSGYSIVSP